MIGKCKTPLWLAGKSLFVVDDAEFVCGKSVFILKLIFSNPCYDGILFMTTKSVNLISLNTIVVN